MTWPSLLGYVRPWRWMQRHEVGLGGRRSNPPSHPRADAPCWQPLGGRAQGDGTSLKAREKCILLADAHMDALRGCSPLLQAKAPAAQRSPTLALGGLGQSKNRASSTPCPAPLSQPPPKFSSGTFLGLMQFVYLITLDRSPFQPFVQVPPEPTQTLHVHSPPWVLALPLHQLLASCHSPSPCTMTPIHSSLYLQPSSDFVEYHTFPQDTSLPG